MRKFLLKVSIFAAYAVILSVITSIWIDPFNVFHWENIRANGVMPNKNYIKMKYILANPEKFDSFIFGSSRVGAIHTDKITTREKCYNMIYSTGLPGWHLLNIKTMVENDIHPKKIYIGIDSVSYTGDYDKQINDPMRCPYEYLSDDIIRFMKLYFDSGMVLKSLNTIIRSFSGKIEVINTKAFYEYGWDIPYEREKNFDWSNKREAIPSFGSEKADADIDLALKIIREISDICRENNIELILFTNPMHRITYLASVKDKDYLRFLEGLAEISDFWNFSSLSDITTNNANYIETSHYRAEVGDIMIDIMCNGKSYPELQAQGFGVKVTKENARDFIEMLRRQAENYRE